MPSHFRVAPLRSGAQPLMSKRGSPPPVTASSAFASGAPHQLSTTEEEQETPGSTASTVDSKTLTFTESRRETIRKQPASRPPTTMAGPVNTSGGPPTTLQPNRFRAAHASFRLRMLQEQHGTSGGFEPIRQPVSGAKSSDFESSPLEQVNCNFVHDLYFWQN
ncbi:hypothetical protein QR680_018246 [Steinernema hermaphroditum]|uniref:Uncharacterized protein n=1 Tax=Steinernema hermaphroditum TaxID=289476 RepID=A0AA39LQP7_9BILA|nr:hypothetical protein QR680_018246 [Steinernema hermaphroditum]